MIIFMYLLCNDSTLFSQFILTREAQLPTQTSKNEYFEGKVAQKQLNPKKKGGKKSKFYPNHITQVSPQSLSYCKCVFLHVKIHLFLVKYTLVYLLLYCIFLLVSVFLTEKIFNRSEFYFVDLFDGFEKNLEGAERFAERPSYFLQRRYCIYPFFFPFFPCT